MLNAFNWVLVLNFHPIFTRFHDPNYNYTLSVQKKLSKDTKTCTTETVSWIGKKHKKDCNACCFLRSRQNNFFPIASMLDWWCKIFENKRECIFPAIKRAIKRVKTLRKYLEKNGFKIPTFAIYLMAPLIPFVALIKKKQ